VSGGEPKGESTSEAASHAPRSKFKLVSLYFRWPSTDSWCVLMVESLISYLESTVSTAVCVRIWDPVRPPAPNSSVGAYSNAVWMLGLGIKCFVSLCSINAHPWS
jgi:hypothetical protein